MTPTNDKKRERILVLAPTGRDGALIAEAVSPHGLTTEICSDAAGVAAELPKGAGVVLIAEEALTPESISRLRQAFGTQPPWSDLPIIVLSIAGESTPLVAHLLKRWTALGNVTVIERPVRPATLLSVITAALRARRRQYEVQRLFDNLLVAEDRLRTIIESAQDYAIINLNLAGEVTYWNAGAERLLGYPENAIIGKPIDIVFSDEDRRSSVPARERDTALRTGHAETEGWRVRRDGSRFWASGVVNPTRDAAGLVTGFVKVLRDMTAQKRSEERLAEQALALQQSNDDLQRFAYVASHDLQEPLRKIRAFGDRLKSKCSGELSPDGEDCLRRMQNAAARMQTLIQDLLSLSRVSSQGQPLTPVDLGDVMRAVISDLEIRMEQVGTRVEVGLLPVVVGDRVQLGQLFQNLIANALKFHKPEEPPVVEVWSEAVSGRPDVCQIVVRDHGIGFDEKYLDRIFQVFQRLHGRSEYEGTGIGLALCRKIVERHDGAITASSAPGEGARFVVTLRCDEFQGEIHHE